MILGRGTQFARRSTDLFAWVHGGKAQFARRGARDFERSKNRFARDPKRKLKRAATLFAWVLGRRLNPRGAAQVNNSMQLNSRVLWCASSIREARRAHPSAIYLCGSPCAQSIARGALPTVEEMRSRSRRPNRSKATRAASAPPPPDDRDMRVDSFGMNDVADLPIRAVGPIATAIQELATGRIE